MKTRERSLRAQIRRLLECLSSDDHQRVLDLLKNLNQAAVPYMALSSREKSFLPRMKKILKIAGFDGKPFAQVLLIGGSAGKGSLAHEAQARLHTTDKPCALFSSPFAIACTENISLAPGELVDITAYLEALRDWKERLSDQLDFSMSAFELELVTALSLFRESGAYSLVLEVGAGGMEDATAAVEHDGAILTMIGKDHMPRFGNTLYELTREKAMMVGVGKHLFTFEANQDFQDIMKGVCLIKKARFDVLVDGALPEIFEILGWQFKQNIERPTLVGRLNTFTHESGGHLWLDGAHNELKIRPLVTVLRNLENKPVLFFGCRSDKDGEQMLDVLSAVVGEKITIFKRLETEKTKPEFHRACQEAIDRYSHGEKVVVCGSFDWIRPIAETLFAKDLL